DLVDRAGLLTSMAHDLREFLHRQSRCGRWCRRRRGWFGRLADQVERWFDLPREIHWRAVSVNVHVIDARLVPEEVVVKRGCLEAVVQQSRHYRVHFVL